MKLVLVTGASGFIGRVLCQRLMDMGIRVRAMLREKAAGPWTEVVLGDLLDSLSDEVMQGVDTVFHLAGKAHALSDLKQHDAEYAAINTDATRKLLEAAQARSVGRFIYFSSVKTMGEGGALCIDETYRGKATTPYGQSKLAAERCVLEGGYVSHPVVLRLTMVYGPSRKGNLPRMIEAVARRRFPPLAEFGNKRSMVHVEDVVQAALLVAERREAAGQAYIISEAKPYSTRQIYELICASLDRPVPRMVIPQWVLKLLAKTGDAIGWLRGRRFMFDSDALEKLSGSAWYSSDKIRRELGFESKRDLQTSLPEIVAWLGLK